MSDFPSSIRKSDWKLFKQKRHKGQIRTLFEGGAVQSRARHTAGRWIFTIGWEYMTTAEHNALVSHFDDNLGGMFNWTHIITNAVHVVRYVDDELPEAIPIGDDYWGEVNGIVLEETQASSLSFATTTTSSTTTTTTTTS